MKKYKLEPKIVWKVYYDIFGLRLNQEGNQISLSKKVKSWLQENIPKLKKKVEIFEDDCENLNLKIPATSGKEHVPSLLIQTLMNTESSFFWPEYITIDGESHLFQKQGQETYFLSYYNTVYSDNLALVLAFLLEIDKINSHGPLEILIVATKGADLYGARDFNRSKLHIESKYLINFLGDDIGFITYASAGFLNLYLKKKAVIYQTTNPDELDFMQLEVSGLAGGEIGSGISDRRLNAIKIIAKILTKINQKNDVYISSWEGGISFLSIPQKSAVIFGFKKENLRSVQEIIEFELNSVQQEKNALIKQTTLIEPNLATKCHPVNPPQRVLSEKESADLISIANLLPNGVLEQNQNPLGFINLLANLAAIETLEDSITLMLQIRGFQADDIANLKILTYQLASLANYEIEEANSLLPWTENLNSPMLNFISELYQEVLKQPVNFKKTLYGTILGGIKAKIPDIQALELGPDLLGQYPKPFKMNVKDVKFLFQLLKKIVKSFENIEDY